MKQNRNDKLEQRSADLPLSQECPRRILQVSKWFSLCFKLIFLEADQFSAFIAFEHCPSAPVIASASSNLTTKAFQSCRAHSVAPVA